MLTDLLGLDTDANSATPDIQKPSASFESKLGYVLEHVLQNLKDELQVLPLVQPLPYPEVLRYR